MNSFRYFNLSVIFYMVLFVCNGILAQNSVSVGIVDFDYSPIKTQMEKNSSALLTSINTAYSNKTKPVKIAGMTDYAYSTLLQIWEVSTFRCLEMDIIERAIITPKGGYEIRNIPVYITEASKNDENHDIVLVFNSNGVIEDLYNALPKMVYNRLLQEGEDVKDIRLRQIVLDFIENFRTSYNRRDINYLEKVYSDDAVIITGQVIKTAQVDGRSSLPKEEIRYNKQTKAQYLSKMKTIFNSVSYININFADIEIVRHTKFDNIYGVSLNQDWNTTGYSDKGYLFLVIDFTNEDNPLIDVRTWSPNNPNAKKYKLSDFKIN